MEWLWQKVDDLAYKMYWDREVFFAAPMYINDIFTGSEDSVEIKYFIIGENGLGLDLRSKSIPKTVYNKHLTLLQPQNSIVLREIGLHMSPGGTGTIYEYDIVSLEQWNQAH